MAIFEVPQAGTGAGIFAPPEIEVPTLPQPLFAPTPMPPTQFGMGSGLEAYGSTPLGQYMKQKQMEMMQAAGVVPGMDWSAFDETNPLNDPAVQHQANQTAIAKIATANPELAAQLAGKLEGDPEPQGLWDSFKEAVAPVMSVGAKALDLLSRPMHIVPEMITDDENDTWYENIGQALAGNSTASWSEVIDEEMGIENNVVQAVGGFVGDVLTDPLTYMGFGMLGIGRRVAQATVSQTVARGVIQKGIKGVPTEVQEKAIWELTNRFTTLAKRAPEASAAHLAKYIGDIPGISAGIRDEAVRAAHEATQLVGRGLGGKALGGGVLEGGIEYSSRDILRQAAAKRVGPEARAAAAALGGVRVKAGIPFMGYRYSFTSGALPFTEGRKFIGVGGNFFRGTSGMTKLQQYLNKNPGIDPATREAMYTTWTQGGFRAFSKEYGLTMKELGDGGMNFGSMFVEASTRMGRVTASLSPRSNAYRHGGLVGVAAANAARSAQALQGRLTDQAYELWAEVDEITGEALPAVSKVDYEKSVRTILEDNKNTAQYIEWLETIDNPAILKLDDDGIRQHLTTDAARRRLNLENSVQARLAEGIITEAAASRELKRIADQFDAEVAKADEAIKRMRNADSLIDDDKKPHLYNYRRGMRQIMEMGDQHGNKVGDRSTTVGFADVISPNDRPRFTLGGNPQVAAAETYAKLQGAGPRVVDATTTKYGVRGIEWTVGDEAAEGGTTVPGPWQDKYGDWADEVDIEVLTKYREFDRGDGSFSISREKIDNFKKKFLNGDEGVTEPLILSYNKEGRVTLSEGNHRLAAARELVEEGHTQFQRMPVKMYFAKFMEADEGVEAAFKPGVLDTDDYGFIKIRRGLDGEPKPSQLLNEGIPTRGQRVAVRAENPLVMRDGLLTDAPLIDAWRGQLEDLFNNPDIRKTFVAEDLKFTDDAEWQKFVDEEVQLHLSRKALDAGYDSIVEFKTVDGVEKVVGGVSLIDPKMKRGIGMASLSDDVGQSYGGRGYFPIMASDELLKSAYGERHARSTKDIRMGDFVHEKERVTNESIFDLNARLKEKYNLKGDAVKMDLGEVYNLYAQRTATGAAQRQLGIAAESMHALYGKVAPEMVTSLNRYLNKGFLDHGAVKKLSDQASKHYDNWTTRQQAQIEKQEKVVERYAQEVQRIRAAAMGEGLTRPAVAVRQLGGKRVGEGVDLGKKVTELQKRKLKIQVALKQAKTPGRRFNLEADLRTTDLELQRMQAKVKEAKKGAVMKPGTPDRVVKALEKQSDALEAQAERVGKLTLQQQRQLERAEMAVERAAKELSVLRARFEAHMAKAVPAFTSDSTKAGYDAITGVPELRGLYAHPYIAAEFENALAGKGLTDARKEWRRFQGVWKSWATVYYPGFHVRNNIGAWFNNMLGGVGTGHYAYSHRISNALKGGKYADQKIGKDLGHRFGIDPNTTWKQLGETFHSMGVRSSNSLALADQQEAVGVMRRWQSGKLSRAEKISAGAGRSIPARLARKGTETTENFHRQAAMLRGLEVTGGDYAGARAFTMMRHGDYEDLNDFEHFIKDVIPFYKWMRMNLPFQIHQLLESPGKHLATAKAANASIVLAGEDPSTLKDKLPKSAREAFNFALPRGVDGDEALQLISVDLPMADLFQGASDFLSSALPLVTPFAEAYVLKKNIYSGAPITGKRTPLAGWMQLPGIEQLLSPFIETDANGNKVMSDQHQKILNIIPVFSRFRPWAFADEKSTQRRTAALMSAFAGIRPEDFNEEDLLAHEKSFFYEYINPEIENLRNLGAPLPEPSMIDPSVFASLGFTPPAPQTT